MHKIKKELVTKADLQVVIKGLEIRLIKWIVGSSFASAVSIIGILKYVH